MLKVRLMGTKNDIAWFQKILQRHPKIEVMELSELYSNTCSRITVGSGSALFIWRPKSEVC